MGSLKIISEAVDAAAGAECVFLLPDKKIIIHTYKFVRLNVGVWVPSMFVKIRCWPFSGKVY